jgi:hypothetical protein
MGERRSAVPHDHLALCGCSISIEGGAAGRQADSRSAEAARWDFHHWVCSAMHTDLGCPFLIHGIKAIGKASVLGKWQCWWESRHC